jgi:hypothetical protein
MPDVTGGSAQRRGDWLAASGHPSASAWLAGAQGERRVADALAAVPEGWTVLHDRLLMPGLTESNLDHVAIGPPGVFLIDAKNFSGEITVWQDSLYQHLGPPERRTSRNLFGELRKVHWMAVQASRRLGMPVTPVLALAGNRHGRFGDPELVSGVWVVPVSALVGWLAALPVRLDPDGVRRLGPRVMTEFPSTETDPELLAAIGRELSRTTASHPPQRSQRRRARSAAPAATSHRATPRPFKRGRGRRRWPLRFLRLTVLVGVLVLAAQNAGTISAGTGALLGSYLSRGLDDVQGSPRTPPEPATSASGTAPLEMDCEALSSERLSTYVKTHVTARHWMDGTCMWVSDPSDPRTIVLTVEQLSPRSVAHLPGDTVSLRPYTSLDPPGPTSILLAREGQWIPVADRRTAVRWPMRMEIHRGQLGIDDHRGQQILRAAAADLNAPFG